MITALWLVPLGVEQDVITNICNRLVGDRVVPGSGGTIPDLVTPPTTIILCVFCPEENYSLLEARTDCQEIYRYPDGFTFASFSPIAPWAVCSVWGCRTSGALTLRNAPWTRRAFIGVTALATGSVLVLGAAAKGEKLNNVEITAAKRTKLRKFCEDKKHAEWPKAKLEEAFKAQRTKEREVARGVAKGLCGWRATTLEFMYLGTE